MADPTFMQPDPSPRNHAPARRRAGKMVVAVVLLVPLAACATKRDVRDLGDDLRAQNQAQSQVIGELRAEIAQLQELTRSLASNEQERQAQLLVQIRSLQEDLAQVREVAGASQAGVAAVRDALDRGAPPPRGGSPGGAFQFDEGNTGGEAEELYTDALTAHGRESLAAARFGFQEIVERFPRHALVPDARYYLADILAQEGDEDEALRRFLQVAELHPTAQRVPESLYRAGLIHWNRGESSEARALFTRVVNTYPDTEVAELARAYLGGTGR